MTDQTTARDREVDEALECADEPLECSTWDINQSVLPTLAAEVRRLRALAGAPTADVAAMEETIEILSDPDTMDAIREGQMVDAGPGVDLRSLAAPEGVDAADELAEYGIKDPAELLRRYKLMWAAAADELTAAQATIQRVRAVAERHTRASFIARDVLRELDGDTTGEGR